MGGDPPGDDDLADRPVLADAVGAVDRGLAVVAHRLEYLDLLGVGLDAQDRAGEPGRVGLGAIEDLEGFGRRGLDHSGSQRRARRPSSTKLFTTVFCSEAFSACW